VSKFLFSQHIVMTAPSAIKDLCMRRFIVPLVKSLHSVYQNMLGNAKNFIAKQDYYNKHLDQGKIAQETYDKKIKQIVEDAIEDMKDVSLVIISSSFRDAKNTLGL
jgi:hypothetical protein